MCDCSQDLIAALRKEFDFTEDDELQEGALHIGATDCAYNEGVIDTKYRILSFLTEWENK